MLLQLLQRAADTPEELLLYTSELTTAGLLSRTVIEQLCSSLGVRPEVLAAAAGGTPVPADADAAAPAAADDAGASTAAAEAPPTVFGSLLQAGVLPSRQQLTKLSLHQPQAANIADGLRSRFASEFVPLKKLGHGAFGSVFRARHALDGREYAIKRVAFWLEPGRSGSAEEAAQRALREVQALAVLNHPNVCRYYSAWIETDWASLQPATAAAVRRAQPAVPLLRGPQLVAAMDASEDADAAAAAAASTSGGVIFEDGSSAAPLSASAERQRRRRRRRQRRPRRQPQPDGRPPLVGDGARVGVVGRGDAERRRPLRLVGAALAHVIGRELLVHAGAARAERAALNGAAGMPGAAGGAGMPGARLQWSYRKALFIQMELCEARTLRDYLQARDREVAAAPAERRGYAGVHCAESLNLWHQITAGLHHVHVCGLVHRDLKPANCCFQGSYIKLMDFGLARYYGKAKGPNPMAEGADLAGDGDSPSRARQRVGGTAGVGTPGTPRRSSSPPGSSRRRATSSRWGSSASSSSIRLGPRWSAPSCLTSCGRSAPPPSSRWGSGGRRWRRCSPPSSRRRPPRGRPPTLCPRRAGRPLARLPRPTPSPPSSPSPAASPSSVPFGASSPPGPTGRLLTDLPPLSPALPPAALPPAAATALPPSCADAAAAAFPPAARAASGVGSGACDDASSAAAQLGRTVLTVSTAGRAPSPEVVAAAAGGSSTDADAEGGTPLQQQWRAELEAEQKAHDATREALAAMKAQLQAERDAHMRRRRTSWRGCGRRRRAAVAVEQADLTTLLHSCPRARSRLPSPCP